MSDPPLPPSPVLGPPSLAIQDISDTVIPVTVEKLSYRTVDALIRHIYTDPNTVRSTALDILAIYLKGQKILYTEAKTFCEHRLHVLMIPAILITAICSIVSLQLKGYEHGAIIVSSLNGVNTLLLTLVTYLKLDAKAEAHRVSAYKYDKLQAFCEFKSGKILFLNDVKDNVNDIIDQIETQVREIKETNQFIIPERIRHDFRSTYGRNIFTRVKEIQTTETLLVNQLKGEINALLSLYHEPVRDMTKILDYERRQNETLDAFIRLRQEYMAMDHIYDAETLRQIRRSQSRWNCIQWFSV
jgi:hypothetical protein